MKRNALLLLSASVLSITNLIKGAEPISATLNFNKSHTISPLIYGFNQDHELGDTEKNLASHRLGGNRMSTFNWEINVENSGEGSNSNWGHLKGILGVNWNDRYSAGEVYRKFHQDNLDKGLTSIITVPIVGWVAADDKRTVTTGPHGADSLRWNKVVYQKGAPFSLTPDTTDRVVYLDESVNFLVKTFGDATTKTGVKYISLGNEPGLWNTTHELLQEEPLSCEIYVQKVIAAAKAVKAVDPKVKVVAGEFAGINIYDLRGAPDWATLKGEYRWFIDYFLDELKKASDEVGFPLIDVLAIHNYPQHKIGPDGSFDKGGVVVKDSKLTDDYIRKARMDFPRNMWDTTYIEPSWITESKLKGEAHNILGRLQNSIDTYFPGVTMMLGEFDYGFDADISHGLALADLLGVFGSKGVEIATRWDLESGNEGIYTAAAYKLFRNYDGEKSTFGDISVNTSFTNTEGGSVWASLDSDDGDLHIVLINKELQEERDFTIALGEENISYTLKEIYGFDETGGTIVSKSFTGTLTQEQLSLRVPKLSAFHVVLKRDGGTALTAHKQMKRTIRILPSATGLHISGIEGVSKVLLFTPSGKRVAESRVIDGFASTGVLASGCYFVQLKGSFGIFLQKIVF